MRDETCSLSRRRVHAWRALPKWKFCLNYLAPNIVVAILSGRQPAGLTASQLMADTRLPLEWSAQRAALGFG